MRIAISTHKKSISQTSKKKNSLVSQRPALFLTLLIALLAACQNAQPPTKEFDGGKALEDVAFQVGLGSRTPGSQAHARTTDWISTELEEAGWEAREQISEKMGHRLVNIVATRGGAVNSNRPYVILGAHYDSRLFADQDPDPAKRSQPVPGANDGASGVAVLLELARSLPEDLPVEVWLAFFDGEDNGRIEGWDWILGSRAFAENLQSQEPNLPEAVVIVDMIGDKDLNIYMEKNSHPGATAQIWQAAESLGFSSAFIGMPKHRILDDHIPFLELGIAAVDIIDFDYPHWHTSEDTLDKVSAESLQMVGETLTAWLKEGAPIENSE